MKFLNTLLKIMIAFLAICGICYIFVDIVKQISEQDDEECEDAEYISFAQKVKNAAGRQIARIK